MKAICKFNCAGDATDELNFMKNDVILNVSPASDGWYFGTLQRNGNKGLFPGNYVQFVNDSNTVSKTEIKMDNTDESISAKDEEKFGLLFDQNDTNNDGYLEAVEVKPIFIQSQLSKEVLARVWALSDVDKDGRLSRREFILGMWIIAKHLKGGSTIPVELSPKLAQWTAALPSRVATTQPLLPSHQSETSIEPKKQKQQQPNMVEMYTYSKSKDGKELAKTTSEFAQSDVGKNVAAAAYENRDQIIKAAESEQGKKAIAAAWDNREQVGKYAGNGMKLAAKMSSK